MSRVRIVEIAGLIVAAIVIAFAYEEVGLRQVAAVKTLVSSGARTSDDGNGRIFSVALNDREIGGETIESLAALPHVECVSLSRSTIASEQFGVFSKMRNLRSLSLRDTPVGDK